MGKIKLLNTNNNGYFENNQIDISDNIPTEGNHNVGDIIIKETQVEHMAIGWICIEAGNPGVWSEFGGMITDDRELVIDPESIGMNELTADIKVKLGLINSLSTTVKQIQNDYVTKEDLNNIDVSGTVGILDNLQTEDKTNLVNSINEVYNKIEEINANLSGNMIDSANTINDIIDLL